MTLEGICLGQRIWDRILCCVVAAFSKQSFAVRYALYSHSDLLMDVILRTHNPEQRLDLLRIERFEDNSGFCCELAVRSYGFGGFARFCFEPEPLRIFCQALASMDRSLSGSATLKPLYEEPFIHLEVSRTGAVTVSGEVSLLQDGLPQKLQFGFRTDQTCLRPFATDLEACFHMAADNVRWSSRAICSRAIAPRAHLFDSLASELER